MTARTALQTTTSHTTLTLAIVSMPRGPRPSARAGTWQIYLGDQKIEANNVQIVTNNVQIVSCK